MMSTAKEKPVLKMVDVDDLFIDHSYQRGLVSDITLKRIIDGFNPAAFGCLVAMNRGGRYFLTDGQQRLAVAKMMGIKKVPCAVYPAKDIANEAGAFVGINIRKTNVRPIHKFRALVLAGVSPEKEIAEWLDREGFQINSNSGPKDIEFPTRLVNTWITDQESAKKAVLCQYDIEAARPHSRVYEGLWYLFKNGIDVNKYVEKIRRQGGITAILRSIKTIELETGQRNYRIAALGIVRIVNYKTRKARINLSLEE